VLGWQLADHMRTEIVTDSLDQAIATRFSNVAGTIFHADRGSQFRRPQGRGVVRHLRDHSLHGRDGSCYDHASANRSGRSSSTRYFYRHVFATMNELRAGVADYINFYNHQRRCAKAGGVSPIRYEFIVGSRRATRRINRVYFLWELELEVLVFIT